MRGLRFRQPLPLWRTIEPGDFCQVANLADSGPLQPVRNAGRACSLTSRSGSKRSTFILWLQGITFAWMLVECAVSLYAAHAAHSPALLAFGSDSLVELLSATIVALHFIPRFSLSEQRASRAAAVLLFALAAVVAATTVAAFALGNRPESSLLGIGITLAALAIMPVLAALKRHEALRIKNFALAADAAQSATCAYLALVTLLGLAINAAFGIAWFDSVAALVAIPLLIAEGRNAWQGASCGCH